MDIVIEDSEFVPINFVLCNFYGEETCFCWNNDKFVMFPYMIKKYTSSLSVLLAPGPVKSVRCFSNRIFFTCLPRGVYKFSRDRRFSVLSKSAISIGSVFFETLTLKNDGLYLENKQNKSSKLLLHLSVALQEHEELCTFPLHIENSEEEFRNILLDEENTVDNLCLFGCGKKLFILAMETVCLIYNCDSRIVDIVPIQNDEKANGLVLITNTDAIIVVYTRDNNLRFKKIYLGIKIEALCAGFNQYFADNIWIIYSDESKLYYMTMMLSNEIYSKVKTEEKSFICMQYYKKDLFVGLTKQKQLDELSTNIKESRAQPRISIDDFTNLHIGMLKNSDTIVNKICDEAKELQLWNEKLLTEEDKLYRINLYASKKKIQMCPSMTVHRIIKQLFLNINFPENLPKNVYIACSLTCNNETIFSIKEVCSGGTSIDLPISTKTLSNSLKLNMDLIAVISKGQSWFIFKDFLADSIIDKKKKKQHKKTKASFINAKINLIRNMIASGNLDMKKLSEIKKSVRKEMCDI